ALPLKGVVLCSTSLSQDVRTLLAEISTSMGAGHRLDLTTDVTHLIVGQVDTPKYKHVAKERPDIHVLRSEWIEAVRDAWRSGEDFDVAALVEQYRLPALYGLQICVTGFDDLDHRLDMIQSINDHGATYNGDLTRAVTHLIAKRPEGPKYDRAKQWGLKIVSLKWFQESLERGMALEEALYDPLRPETMQGQGAFVREYQREPLLSKRNREGAGSWFGEESGKRKMRRTTSARLNSHSQNLWAEMSGVDDAPAPVKAEDEWNETGQASERVSYARSEVSGLRDITPADSPRPASRAPSVGPEPKRGLFHNCLFLVSGHPEKRFKKIQEILQNEGGQIADFPEDLYSAIASQSHSVTALIVPSEWTSGTREPLPDVPTDTWLVTEWWIERCIVTKSIIDPDKDIYSRPRLDLSSDCFKGFTIGTSGMDNDAKLVQSIAKHAGGQYEEQFKPTCSVLLVRLSTANREKVAYAMKHNVPVISEAWFQSSVNKGEKVSMKPFQMPPSNANDGARERNTSRPPELLRR
ncbi:twin BRCT domain-containing protein, partial [Delphinella strobiligena]